MIKRLNIQKNLTKIQTNGVQQTTVVTILIVIRQFIKNSNMGVDLEIEISEVSNSCFFFILFDCYMHNLGTLKVPRSVIFNSRIHSHTLSLSLSLTYVPEHPSAFTNCDLIIFRHRYQFFVLQSIPTLNWRGRW